MASRAAVCAESMRVLLAQDVPHVEVRSDSDIVLISVNGDATQDPDSHPLFCHGDGDGDQREENRRRPDRGSSSAGWPVRHLS